jgi:GcrA cell cycle regulator
MSGQSPWTDIMIAELKQFWSEGRSSPEIARQLNVSKNSVIGKVRRLHLPRRPSPIRSSEGERKQQIKACRRVIVSAELPPLPCLKTTTAIQDCTPTQTLPVQTGKRGAIFRIDCCCWPIGDPGSSSFQFCEQPALPGKPYCQEHANRAYVRKHVNKVEAINSGSHA